MTLHAALDWINRLLWTALVVAVIAVGAVVGLGRHYIGYLEQYREPLLAELSRRTGYDIAHLKDVVAAVNVPVIASGGAGEPSHFRDAFAAGASGALAATVFHDRLIAIPDLKEYLISCGIEIRP